LGNSTSGLDSSTSSQGEQVLKGKKSKKKQKKSLSHSSSADDSREDGKVKKVFRVV
jgi:hypothetical protein